MSEEPFSEVENGIAYTARQVAERGWVDTNLTEDDFANLRLDARFLDAQVAALYEQYFLPKRHEFEWLILWDIVHAIAIPGAAFVTMAIATGCVGAAAWEALKLLCRYSYTQLHDALGKDIAVRAEGFLKMASDAETLQDFFATTSRARIEQIEAATGLRREVIHPLMKVAGLKHCRRSEHTCYWEVPG